MGATKQRRHEIKAERHLKWLQNYTLSNKYLADKKYYKNNYWSIAHWQSWAAQGKDGSCPCGCGYYNGTLYNRRANTKKGGKSAFCRDVSSHFCENCIIKIEDILGHKFTRKYCP